MTSKLARAGQNLLNSAWIKPFGLLVLTVVLWDLTVRIFAIPAYLIPPPKDVAVAFWNEGDKLLIEAIPTTMATLGGFFLTAAFGIPIAMLIAGSRTVESYVYPLLVFSQSIPKVAVAPLFVIWLGTDAEPKIAIAFLIAVFAIVIDAVLGLKSVPPDILDLARSLRGGRLATLWRIRFPCALPSMFAGMKVGIGLALVGAIVGEFVSSQRGLGYVILSAQGMFDTTRVFVAILVLAVMGVALFWLLAIIERFAIPWHSSQRPASSGH